MVSANALFFDQVMEYNLKNNLHYFFKQSNLSDDILDNIFKENPSAILIHCDKIETSDFASILKSVKLNVLGCEIPLIVCTAIKCEVDKIDTINNGADDVFFTDLSLSLLFCKINTLLRRKDKLINLSNHFERLFCFLENTFELEFQGKRYKLTSKKFVILKSLVGVPEKTFSQLELNEISSGKGVYVSKRCIDTFISLIRKKIGKNCIFSIRNKGYKMNKKIADPNFVIE
jgi:two-component system OmpR family response regulator